MYLNCFCWSRLFLLFLDKPKMSYFFKEHIEILGLGVMDRHEFLGSLPAVHLSVLNEGCYDNDCIEALERVLVDRVLPLGCTGIREVIP